MRTQGGRTNYGEAVGIIMGETILPRIPGDVGNASTFSFPVRYKNVKGALFTRIRTGDPTLIQPYIDAARELEEEGVRAVATSCGFLAAFHKELTNAVKIPVFSSSLLQVHLASRIINPEQKVGIITASAQSLGEKQFRGIGIENIPVVVAGMDESEEFRYTIYDHNPDMDVEKVAREVVQVAQNLVRKNPEIGAIVLECTNMPPYARRIQDAVRLPVFDIVTLINYAYSTLVRKEFDGIM